MEAIYKIIDNEDLKKSLILNQFNNESLLVIVNRLLTPEDVQDLLEILPSLLNNLTQLSLLVDLTILSKNFAQLLNLFSSSALQHLTLHFVDDLADIEVQKKLSAFLNENAGTIDYPLIIRSLEFDTEDSSFKFPPIYQNDNFQRFEIKMVGNIQKRMALPKQTKQQEKRYEIKNNKDAPKITLKALINAPRTNRFDSLLQPEIQHTIELDTQITAEHSPAIEMAIEQVRDIQTFNGELFDYHALDAEVRRLQAHYSQKINRFFYHDHSITYYNMNIIQQNLFGNTPQTISYLSEKALQQVARGLPRLVSLNMHNLPQGFILKKTAKDELVLDYDENHEHHLNAFTPNVQLPFHAIPPLYGSENLPIPNKTELVAWFEKKHKYGLTSLQNLLSSRTDLTNLWVLYGNDGLINFLNPLGALAKRSAALEKKKKPSWPSFYQSLKTTLFETITRYLEHYRYLQYLMDSENSWQKNIDRIIAYNDVELDLLNDVLTLCSESFYDLGRTLDAFDFFWQQFDLLDVKKPYPSLRILCNPDLQVSGSPEVILERLLIILRNSPDVEEQIKALPSLVLNSTGAYHASQYEGFSFVHKDMELDYQTNGWDVYYFDKLLSLPSNCKYYSNSFIFINERKTLYFVNAEGQANEVKPYYKLLKSSRSPALLTEDEVRRLLNYSAGYIQYKDDVFEYDHNGKGYETVWSIKNGLKEAFNQVTDYDQAVTSSFRKGGIEGFSTCGRDLYYSRNLGYTRKLFATASFTKSFLKCFLPPLPVFSHKPLYRTCLTDLYSLAFLDEIIEKTTFYCLLSRYLGQQKTGISYGQFIEQTQEFINYEEKPSDRHLIRLLFASLLFVTHENYDENSPLKPLLKALLALDKPTEKTTPLYFVMIEKLYHLYEKDIRLNNREAQLLSQMVAKLQGSNNCEAVVVQLLELFEQNKLAFTKWQQLYPQVPEPSAGLIPVILDIHTKLVADARIAHVFRDDLLYFAQIIATNSLKETDLPKLVQLLQQAARPQSNNHYYALKKLSNSCTFITIDNFFELMAKVASIEEFKPKVIDNLLPGLNRNLKLSLRPLKASVDLRQLIINFLINYSDKTSRYSLDLNLGNEEAKELSFLYNQVIHLGMENIRSHNEFIHSLEKKPLEELQHIIMECSDVVHFGDLFQQLKGFYFNEAFSALPAAVGELFYPLFESPINDFAEVQTINNQIKELVALFNSHFINYIRTNEKEAINLLASHIEKFEYPSLYNLFFILQNITHSYAAVLKALLIAKDSNPDEGYKNLLDCTNTLLFYSFSSTLLAPAIAYINNSKNQQQTTELLLQTHEQGAIHQKILAFILDEKNHYDPSLISIIAQVSLETEFPLRLYNFLKDIQQADVIRIFNELKKEDRAVKLLKIISLSYFASSQQINEWDELALRLNELNEDHFLVVEQFFNKTYVGPQTLLNALRAEGGFQNLGALEHNPYGVRPAEQFDSSKVNRVIANMRDLNNDSIYNRQHRRALHENFIFVNDCGFKLSIYNKKAAKDLTNQEITELFQAIKQQTFAGDLPVFERQLLALALIREAIYRTTNCFPYSTQMLAIINCLILGKRAIISEIDTGQGKSLIEAMNAAVLWLTHDRALIATSSVEDAMRDLKEFIPFFNLLAIPCAPQILTAKSEFEEFETATLHYTTFAQCVLFNQKAKFANYSLIRSDSSCALVLSEADQVLNDTTIYRLAIPDPKGLAQSNYWIYSAVSEFVAKDQRFKSKSTSKDYDLQQLSFYLHDYAMEKGLSQKALYTLEEEQLLKYIDAAIFINYHLKEKEDYLLEAQQPVVINGESITTHVVKVLLKEAQSTTKACPYSTFGNAINIFLLLSLQQRYPDKHFVISPEQLNVFSCNNTVMLQYFLSLGVVWGATGTVGLPVELTNFTQKYGFVFTKIPPHQPRLVDFNPKPIFVKNEEEQIHFLVNKLKNIELNPNTSPQLIFCKDIITAEKIHAALSEKHPRNLQLYLGVGNEAEVIKQAAQGGMITVSTYALGRNTNIKYNYDRGLELWILDFLLPYRLLRQLQGRTGRQGSKGKINLLYNQSTLQNKDISHIQNEISKLTQKQVEVNENLFVLMDFFLHYFDAIPEHFFSKKEQDNHEEFTEENDANLNLRSNFYKYHWSGFIKECEKFYYQEHINADKLLLFIRFALEKFKKIIAETIGDYPPIDDLNDEQIIKDLFNKNADNTPIPYKPCFRPFSLPDYRPPLRIAYQLSGANLNIDNNADTTSLSKALARMLKHLSSFKNYKPSEGYSVLLNRHEATSEKKAALQREKLSAHIRQTAKQSAPSRFFGCKNGLTKIAQNKHALDFIKNLNAYEHAVKKNDSPILELREIKASITTLLNSYFTRSFWTINADRKKDMRELIIAINSANNIDDLISILSNAQINRVEQDIKINQRRFFKHLHTFGKSRWQNTVSECLSFAMALSMETHTNTLITGLLHHLGENAGLDNLDDIQKGAKDKNNVKVINSCVRAALG